ncbi:hypothetical protein [Aquincola sp. J276]|uniref:hypothetical protein n=1 Tax=Aquincola sp. J276 TaxID=2898432 RepID=UPI00215194A2|nr:hypothetical protein [Aquincola sp. J276]MCR5864642.1 hypothetical protein [Aquincola sp. J276]
MPETPAGPATSTEARLGAIEDALVHGDGRMKALEEAVAHNTELTAEIRELIAAAKLGFRVLGWIGVGAKWTAGLAAAISGVWGVIKLLKGGH